MGNMPIEVLRTNPGQEFCHAVFDFDGTLSLIREGWQKIMIPYFTDELQATPAGKHQSRENLERQAREFIFINTGKQTIFQCIELAERISILGGTPQDPQIYKDEYQRRLLEAIDHRLHGLKEGTISREEMTVPGSYLLLEMLRSHGVIMYLASGTDEAYVLEEAKLLGLTPYFGPHIYGAQKNYKTFSKKMVIDRIITDHQLSGDSLLGFGDGYVEIEDIRSVGGYACGVASNEATREGLDDWKRERLIRAGADIIIPDYRDIESLEAFLFPGHTKRGGERNAL